MKIGPYGNGDNSKHTDCILDLQWNTKTFSIPLNPIPKSQLKGIWYATMRNRNIAIRHNKIAFLGASPEKTNQIFICDADLNVEKTIPTPTATRASMSFLNFNRGIQGHDIGAGRFTVYWNDEDNILVSSTGDAYSFDWVSYVDGTPPYTRTLESNMSSYHGMADGNPLIIGPRAGHYSFLDGLRYWVKNTAQLAVAKTIFSLKNNPTYVSDSVRHILITPSLDFAQNKAQPNYIFTVQGTIKITGWDKADGIQLTSLITVDNKPAVEWIYSNLNYVIRYSNDGNYNETPMCMDDNFVYCLAHPKMNIMSQAADAKKRMVILVVNKKNGQLVKEIQTTHSAESAYNWISKISVSNNILTLFTYNSMTTNMLSAINLDTGMELWKANYPMGSIPHEFDFRNYDPRQNTNHIVTDNKYVYFCYLKNLTLLVVDRFDLLTGEKTHWEQTVCQPSVYTTYNIIDEVCIDNNSLYVLVSTGEAHKTQARVDGVLVTTIKGQEQLLIRIT